MTLGEGGGTSGLASQQCADPPFENLGFIKEKILNIPG